MIAAIAPGFSRRGLGRRLPALADEPDRVAGRSHSAAASAEYSPTEWPTTKSGSDPEALDRPQARDRGRDERGLLHLGAGQLLDRALEADPREVEPDRLAAWS